MHQDEADRPSPAGLADPLLLTVKMLLSEVRSWARKYEFPHYVCTHFSKVVFDSMTMQGVRCGYTIIEFSDSRTHAIVSFNTDYGLIHVEPQSGNTELSLEAGRKCPYSLEGVSDSETITQIKTWWNSDADSIRFRQCRECGYLLPLYNRGGVERCPICDAPYDVKPEVDIIRAETEPDTTTRRIHMSSQTEGYASQISRKNPGCILFLVDQSDSMADNFGGEAMRKADGAAHALNKTLYNLMDRSTKDDKTRHYFDVGVIGYGETVGSAFSGELAGRDLVPISELADYCRVEERQDAGESSRVRIWFDAVAKNRTPMCQALREARRILSDWVTAHEDSYPPVVINITDGEANDGNPVEPARDLQRLHTRDGNVLLFNCHLSSHSASPILYPNTDNELVDEFAKMLFGMSSALPAKMIEHAGAQHGELPDGARGFVFNAKSRDLTRYLDIGTRVAPMR